jgi:hypothetical protein
VPDSARAIDEAPSASAVIKAVRMIIRCLPRTLWAHGDDVVVPRCLPIVHFLPRDRRECRGQQNERSQEYKQRAVQGAVLGFEKIRGQDEPVAAQFVPTNTNPQDGRKESLGIYLLGRVRSGAPIVRAHALSQTPASPPLVNSALRIPSPLAVDAHLLSALSRK